MFILKKHLISNVNKLNGNANRGTNYYATIDNFESIIRMFEYHMVWAMSFERNTLRIIQIHLSLPIIIKCYFWCGDSSLFRIITLSMLIVHWYWQVRKVIANRFDSIYSFEFNWSNFVSTSHVKIQSNNYRKVLILMLNSRRK